MSQKKKRFHIQKLCKWIEESSLKSILQSLKGTDVIIVEKIDILFCRPKKDFSKKPISLTYSSSLELPSTNKSFCEFRIRIY